MIDYALHYGQRLVRATLEHLELALLSIGIAFVIASLITMALLFYPRLRQLSIYSLSLLYTIPSFALFALLIPLTGLGKTSALIALVSYAQYSMVRTFLAGFDQIDQAVIEVAKGMGMTSWQLVKLVKLPLALPAIFAGTKLASTAIIAIATIAATINAGGLGVILFDGLRTESLPKLTWGILLTVALSLLLNQSLTLLESLLTRRKSNQD